MSNVSGNAPTGAPLTWTAIAGPAATLEYRFYRVSLATNLSTMVQDYGPSNTYTWTPAATDEGSYTITAWARSVGSSATYESQKSSGPFTIKNGPISLGSVETDSALPASTGAALTWRAKASGGPAPLQYRFYRYTELGGAWTIVQDYSASSAFTWTPSASEQGRYRISVWVRGAGSTATYDAWRATDFFEVRNGPTAMASVTTETPLPAGTGTPITWKATAAGAGPLEYEFYRFSSATAAWTKVQPYSASSTYTWTPTSAQQGSYRISAWVRRTGSTAIWEAWKATDVFSIADQAVTVTRLSSDAGTRVGVGVPVTFRAEGHGGPGALLYKFFLYDGVRDVWAVLRDYTAENTFTWTPGSADAGSWIVAVWAKRPTSTAAQDAAATSGWLAVDTSTPTVQSFTVDTDATVAVGTPITWKATAGGGPGPIEYRFWRMNLATQTWTMVQDYSWDRSFGWVPEPGEQGTYQFAVWVRRSGSTAAYDGWATAATVTVQ